MRVIKVTKSICNEWIKEKHYRRTLGIFWEGFALIERDKIQGVVCYGQPSPPIQKHAFADRDFRLYELTRLVIQTKTKNAASFLIAHSLKKLKESPCAVISYADSSQGHCGIVYQATNWLYTGAVKAHDKFYIVNGEKLHPTTVRDRYGVTSPVKWAKENNITMVLPEPKQRYFYILGNKRQKKDIRQRLKYPILAGYPKCDQSRYDDGPQILTESPSLETPTEGMRRACPDMVISRDDAAIVGFEIFRTGELCAHGHRDWRYFDGGACVACSTPAARACPRSGPKT